MQKKIVCFEAQNKMMLGYSTVNGLYHKQVKLKQKHNYSNLCYYCLQWKVPFYPWKICMFKLLQSFQCWIVPVKISTAKSLYYNRCSVYLVTYIVAPHIHIVQCALCTHDIEHFATLNAFNAR